jgi:hypothetical protein
VRALVLDEVCLIQDDAGPGHGPKALHVLAEQIIVDDDPARIVVGRNGRADHLDPCGGVHLSRCPEDPCAHTRRQSDPSKRIVQLPPPCSKQARTHAFGSETHHVCRTGWPPLPSDRYKAIVAFTPV